MLHFHPLYGPLSVFSPYSPHSLTKQLAFPFACSSFFVAVYLPVSQQSAERRCPIVSTSFSLHTTPRVVSSITCSLAQSPNVAIRDICVIHDPLLTISICKSLLCISLLTMSFTVCGFFALANGRHDMLTMAANKPTTYIAYDSSFTCSDRALLPKSSYVTSLPCMHRFVENTKERTCKLSCNNISSHGLHYKCNI